MAWLLTSSGSGGRPADARPRGLALLCEHWWAFRGTPFRYWLEVELADVLGVTERPSATNADALYDQIVERLAEPSMRPRALYRRFGIDVLATTDDPCDDLAAHAALRADPTWSGRVDPDLPARPLSRRHRSRLGGARRPARGEQRRRHLGASPASSPRSRAGERTSASTVRPLLTTVRWTQSSLRLEGATVRRTYADARGGTATAGDLARLRQHLSGSWLGCPARTGLSCSCTRVCCATIMRRPVRRSERTPATTSRSRWSSPARCNRSCETSGRNRTFRLVLFTVDETTWSRELAPLAGFYPSVYVGAPWWFLDTPDGDAAVPPVGDGHGGFFKTSGFIDDTRAFCSIPARHDTARRIDAGHLADLVATTC